MPTLPFQTQSAGQSTSHQDDPAPSDDSWSLISSDPGSSHPVAPEENENLRGVVDMGSNGIRFSVSDISAPWTRILPLVYTYRADISLYDVQFDPETGEKIPIPQHIIDDVVAAMVRFKITCTDFGVPEQHIQVLATEATRAAKNTTDFLKAIKSATNLDVNLLKKEDEGRVGAMGAASGFSEMNGLMMDLGGGSTQITWLVFQEGNVRMSPRGSFSFPYGAGALTRRIAEVKRGKSKEEAAEALEELRKHMIAEFTDAYNNLEIPEELKEHARQRGGFDLYLSGGGFRGWGYLLLYMNQVHGHHYPISMINGFAVGRDQFQDTEAVKEVARTAKKVFRISDRRRTQVPAVAFLISVLAEAIPLGINTAHFCQGGVREGYLFRDLPPSVRRQDPLEVATRKTAPQSADELHDLLRGAIPRPSHNGEKRFPEEDITGHAIRAFTNLLYVHSSESKESASTAALYATSTGLMSNTHGVSHADRARIALMLEDRYMGELPPREREFKEAMRHIITPEEVWWTGYLGRVGYLLGALYPAGRIDERKPRIVLSAAWAWNLGKKKDKEGLRLTIAVQKKENDPTKMKEVLEDHAKTIQKVGKKKNWIGGEKGEDGWGMKVQVRIVEVDILGKSSEGMTFGN